MNNLQKGLSIGFSVVSVAVVAVFFVAVFAPKVEASTDKKATYTTSKPISKPVTTTHKPVSKPVTYKPASKPTYKPVTVTSYKPASKPITVKTPTKYVSKPVTVSTTKYVSKPVTVSKPITTVYKSTPVYSYTPVVVAATPTYNYNYDYNSSTSFDLNLDIEVARVSQVSNSNTYYNVQQVYTPVSCSMYATASNGSGQPVTLSWNSSNASYAFLSPGGSVQTNGSQVVYPTTTTTYTLTVTSSQGLTSNCQTIVYVNSTAITPSCSIYANPSTINNQGNSTTLTWSSSNATSASLTNTGTVSTSGSQTVTPSGTTTYILTVYNAQGQSSNCQTTVNVGTIYNQAPSCWITISNYNQYNYNYNQQATLSWGSTNATSAYINPSVGSVSTSGSRSVYQSGNQAYTMTVYNAQGQSATCQTSVYTQPGAISCTITANPVNIQNGNSSYLSWTSTGATSAYLSDGLGNVATNGTLTVRPETSRNYTLTVTGANGTQTCNTYVTVSGSTISLTQIPYTGFDLGPIGNTLYWFAIIAVALAGGYLVVYYMPFARMRTVRSQKISTATILSESVSAPSIFTNAQPEFIKEVPVMEEVPEALPVFRAHSHEEHATTLKDEMSFTPGKNGDAPHISIRRA